MAEQPGDRSRSADPLGDDNQFKDKKEGNHGTTDRTENH